MAVITNRILIGPTASPLITIENDNIEAVSFENAASIIGDELSIDTFTASIFYTVTEREAFVPSDSDAFVTADGYIFCGYYNQDIRLLPFGTNITYYCGSEVRKYYVANIERTGKGRYTINGVSAIGLLDRQMHGGGIYTGQTMVGSPLFGTVGVLDSLLGYIADGEEPQFAYSVDTDVANTRVYGWLPYATRRENLYQLLMAYGVNIVRDNNGNMRFTFLNNDWAIPIYPAYVFSGGSIVYNEPASRVEVTEHAFHYLPSAADEVLFDNTGEDAVTNSIVTFNKPIYPDSIRVEEGSQFTIHAKNENFALISGIGKLVGKPYVHTTKLVMRENENAPTENVVQVKDATLITVANSEGAAERFAQYYFNATIAQQDIDATIYELMAGKKLNFTNAFNEQATGILKRMSVRVTSIKRASCEIVQGYEPTAAGATFTQEEIISLPSGRVTTWSIPSEVLESDTPLIRVVLIGFGDDGEAGTAGEDGGLADQGRGGKGGAGGTAGAGGKGAKVFSQTVDCTGLTSIILGNSGRNSYATVSGTTYTSADGASSPNGWYDIIGGEIYALPGHSGIDGGAGGDGGYWRNYRGSSTDIVSGTSGENVTVNSSTSESGSGGSGSGSSGSGSSGDGGIEFEFESNSIEYARGISNGTIIQLEANATSTSTVYYGGAPGEYGMVNGGSVGISSNIDIYSGGGGGGGAAAGANGGNGNDGLSYYYDETTQQVVVNYQDADVGGAGANAGAAEAADSRYGCGGNGGHGGGGGGGAGLEVYYNDQFNYLAGFGGANGGAGGSGSAGSSGSPGCAIIYY